jgi:hypothetical protein
MIGVKACGKPAGGNLHAASFETLRILALDECVQVRKEEEAFHIRILGSFHAGTKCSAVVSKVKGSGGIDACKDAFGHVKKNQGFGK